MIQIQDHSYSTRLDTKTTFVVGDGSKYLSLAQYFTHPVIMQASCTRLLATVVSKHKTGADPRMVRIGTGPPFWQINHTNSAYFRLFLGYFGVISATRPPLLDLGPPFYISWIRPCKNKIEFPSVIGCAELVLFATVYVLHYATEKKNGHDKNETYFHKMSNKSPVKGDIWLIERVKSQWTREELP